MIKERPPVDAMGDQLKGDAIANESFGRWRQWERGLNSRQRQRSLDHLL